MKPVMKRLSVFLFSMAMVLSAWALDLQTAKNQGLVGETTTGYLGVVKSAAGVDALVSEVNTARKNHYKSIAARNGTSLNVVELLAGKKAIEKASPGHYVKQESGGWTKK